MRFEITRVQWEPDVSEVQHVREAVPEPWTHRVAEEKKTVPTQHGDVVVEHATVRLDNLDELLDFVDALGDSVVLDAWEEGARLTIYDDYME